MVTLRDIQRSINQTVRNATVDTDGQTTLDAIDTFLDEHGTTIDALSKNAVSSTTSPTTISGGTTATVIGGGSSGTTAAAATTAATTNSSTTAASAAATAVAVTTGIGSSSNTTINSETIDRLSNDLFQLYNTIIISPPPSRNVSNIVSCSPEALLIHNQHYLILLFVRKLVPLLSPDRIFFHDWWPMVLKPVLKTASYTDKVRCEARGIVSDCLILEKLLAANNNNKYAKMIVDEYLGWSENYHKREEDSLERLDKHQVTTTTTSTSSSFYGEQHQHDETTRLRLQHQALLDLEQDEWSKSLVAILLSFGAAETKRFFMLLNEYFLQSKHRLQIVYLLSEFLLRKRTHLHEILETELFTSMLKSMMYDNSTTLIAMSVTNLIMILPRICTSLPPHLPQLFYIFARALCWDQLRDIRQKQSRVSHGDQPSDTGELTSSSSPAAASSLSPSSSVGNNRIAANGWDCADYTFSKLSAPPSNPLTGPFFTSLYGLYPCNFVKFLHAPYFYFVGHGFDMPEEFDEETFRSRTLTQVSRHMLHPSLITMDTETELTDRSRWMKMEPPDVIAQIMSLDLTNAASRVAFSSDKQQRSGNQPDLLNESIWALTGQVPRPSSSSMEDQQEQMVQEESESKQQKQEQDTTTTTIIDTVAIKTPERKQQSGKGVNSILDMHRALKSGAEVLVGDDVWDADLERFSSPSPSASVSPLLPDPVSIAAISMTDDSHLPETSITSPTPSTTTTISPETKLLIAALKREVLLLRNELNFELFVKQQHLQHMGRLHREHVVDSSVEAERQRTYNATRILRAQLKEANTALTKLKAESALTTQKHIKWEDEQGGKLRSYREARKKWQADMEEARQKLQEQEQLTAEQHIQLLKSQQEVFELKNELKTRQPLLEKAAENEHRVMQLTKQMLLWEKDTAHLEEQKEYIKGLLSQWWGMEELVASLQAENQRLTKLQSELNDEKEKISRQLEEQIKRESLLKKEVNDIDQTEKGVHKKQLQEMTQIINELKEKIDDLQMERLECRAQIERTKHITTDKQKEEEEEEEDIVENDENDDK